MLISRKVDQKLEFPRNRLILDETIGEGEFGRVGVIVFNYFQRSQTIYFTWFKLDLKKNQFHVIIQVSCIKVKSGRALDLPPKAGYTR